MTLEFAILAGALTAIYAGMKNIMDTVYVINGKRDLILDIDKNGLRLDRARKFHLLYTDVKPMIIGLSLFLSVYTSAFFILGGAIHAGVYRDVHWYLALFLDAAGIASLYALWIVVTKNRLSFSIMRAYVEAMDGPLEIHALPNSSTQPSDLEAEASRNADSSANNPMHGSGEVGRT